MSTLSPAIAVGILLSQFYRWHSAYRQQQSGVSERADLVSNRHVFTQLDIARPGVIHQRQIQCLIETFQLMDKGTSAVDCRPGQMSLAFAISLNIEGQLNVAAGVAGAIEVKALVIWTVFRAISGGKERAERA